MTKYIKSKSGFGTVSVISVIFALLVFLAGGYFTYQYQKIKNLSRPSEKLAPPSVSKLASPKTEPASFQIDTSNWKTYRNEKYGFEVKYPQPKSDIREPDPPVENEPGAFFEKNYQFGVLLRNVGMDFTSAFPFRITIFKESLRDRLQTILEDLKRTNTPIIEALTDIKIAGTQGIQVGVDTGEGGRGKYVLWERGGLTYEVFYGTEDYHPSKDLAQEILLTFKFIK